MIKDNIRNDKLGFSIGVGFPSTVVF